MTPQASHLVSQRLSLDQFHTIAQIAYDEAGLNLPPAKLSMVAGRLSKRMRALGIADTRDYLSLLEGAEKAAERMELVSSLNGTSAELRRSIADFTISRMNADL